MKNESLDDDSSKHDKSAANLNFSRFGGRKKEATPSDSRDRKRTNFQDIHVDMVDKADEDQDKVQAIDLSHLLMPMILFHLLKG